MNEEQPLETKDSATPPTNLNRRSFLGGLASGFVAFVAAACGRDTPTPTPLPTGCPTPTGTPVAGSSLLPGPATGAVGNTTYLPFVSNNPVTGEAVAIAPTAAPTDTPEPTDTPKPKATPRPPDTPTPTMTPFPAGPPSKLGVVVMRNDEQIFDLVATKGMAVMTTLELDANFVARIKQTSPKTRLIGRIDLPQLQLADLDPMSSAQAFVDQILPIAGDDRRAAYFDGWQAYNEPVANTADEMKRLADFEAERTRLLADRGIRSVIGNFGTGHPADFELWQHFLPAIQAAQEHDGWLGLHEYSAPTIYFMSTRENQGRYPGVSGDDNGWLTLRYRKVYNEVLKPAGRTIPLVFTELGIDGYVQNSRPGPTDGRGWQDFQQYWAENGFGLWGPGAYIEQLVWFDNAMRQDDYVIGACIFALAASSGWQSYDILGPAAAVLQQYLGVHAAA